MTPRRRSPGPRSRGSGRGALASLTVWVVLAAAAAAAPPCSAARREVIVVNEGSRLSKFVYRDGMLASESSWARSGRPIRTGPGPLAGLASHYGGGDPFTASLTASGQTLDDRAFTAAHRTLPLGTWVRVENLANRASVVVRINDRGPFFRDRIIDLSQAAARALGMDGPGLARVELTILAAPAAAVHMRSGASTPSNVSPVESTVATPRVSRSRDPWSAGSAFRTGQSWQNRW
jgi:hypothetical protein